MEQPQLNIDLKNTTGIQNSEGGSVFQQGLILRKISKFIAGTPEDAILPIPVFYDLNGVIEPITGTKATNQRIYLLQNGQKELVSKMRPVLRPSN